MIIDRDALIAGALLLGVFLGGAVVGGVAVSVALRPPHGPPPHGPDGDRRGPPGHRPPPDRVVDDLREFVDLDEQQTAAVRDIVVATDGRIERTFRDGEAQIRALLRPEQVSRFDTFVRRGPGPPPRP